MTRLFTPDDSAHWYTLDGAPVYSLPKAKGDGDRAVTVTDALRMNLLPSVTTVLSAVNKPNLESWKQEQAVLAALTLPRLEDESLDAFAKRVVEDSKAQGIAAAERGNELHALMETIARGLPRPDDMADDLVPYYEGMTAWWNAGDWSTAGCEVSFGDPVEGYGGRVDWYGFAGRWGSRFMTVADWKTKNTKPGEPVRFWPEWAAQLVAYAHGIGQAGAHLVSVVISRNEPGRIESHVWQPITHESFWRSFLAARDLWYSPLGRGRGLPIRRVSEATLADQRKVEADTIMDRIEAAAPHPGLQRGRR